MAGRRFRLAVVVLAVAAAAIRIAYIATEPTRLDQDRDAYLILGRHLAETGQYGVGHPTAFRPPLYPLAVATIERITGGDAAARWGRAALNVVCGVVTVLLTALVGRRLMGPLPGLAAALAMALSPLSIRYAAFSMTESLATALFAALLAVTVRAISLRRTSDAAWLGATLAGAALCRPTAWVAGVALLAVWVAIGGRRVAGRTLTAAAVAAAVASPWVIRNAVQIGRPILLTSHGGYTLALGNNDRFYDEVVVGESTLWQEGQQRWVAEQQAAMRDAGIAGELAEDAHYKAVGYDTIRRRPLDFAAAAWLRLRRLLAAGPATESDGITRAAVACFYLPVLIASGIGVIRLLAIDWRIGLLIAAVPAAVAGVHLVYWANARMRLPAEPMLMLAAASLLAPRRAIAARSVTPSPAADGER